MSQLGACAAVGVSPLDVIRASADERLLLFEAAARARDFHDARDEAFAVRVINRLAEAVNRGRRQR